MKARVIKEWEMYGTTHKVGEIMTIPLHSPGGLPMISDRDAFLLDNGFIEEMKEPLIKQEKIRKAVRAWAEANNAKEVFICAMFGGWGVRYDLGDEDNYSSIDILFKGGAPLQAGEHYTISELCGEEKE